MVVKGTVIICDVLIYPTTVRPYFLTAVSKQTEHFVGHIEYVIFFHMTIDQAKHVVFYVALILLPLLNNISYIVKNVLHINYHNFNDSSQSYRNLTKFLWICVTVIRRAICP